MVKEIKTLVYDYDELSDKAKEKAREWWREGSYDDDWYEQIYEDAAMIGLTITSFDTGRSWEIEGKLLHSCGKVAQLILENHGDCCDTYKFAQEYFRRKRNGNPMTAEEFLHDLLEEYLCILRREAEYLQSDESAEEMIRANEYTFTSDGRRFG